MGTKWLGTSGPEAESKLPTYTILTHRLVNSGYLSVEGERHLAELFAYVRTLAWMSNSR